MPRSAKTTSAKPTSAKTASAKTAKSETAEIVAEDPGQAQARSSGETFLRAQRTALLAERRTYVEQADELKAQADSLAFEHEAGDVQFDEEGGEGGTANMDRELDLLLSAQARAAVDEIDRALAKIDRGTYGRCEQCGQTIPEARLEALPHAALCVVCKAGGLASRR